MTRDELFKWLETCPTSGWNWVGQDEGCVRILFKIEEKEDEKTERWYIKGGENR
tara:strand:+ start:39875 stop:40036 length:162 start_codon:yes stop_codon:yes gene_type:complete